MRQMHTDELYHWGIKGMKWGVRRYQNTDGTLTAAGKQRMSTLRKRPTNNPKKMTDEELNQRIARLQKEKQYLDLKKGTSPGRVYVTDLMKTAGNKVVGGAAGAVGGVVGKVAVDAILNRYGDIAVAAVNATGSDFIKKAAVTASIINNVRKS